MKVLPRIDSKLETEKVTAFIKTVFKDAGKSKAVVAVSGGIDSATSLTLTSMALGPNNVIGLMLPSKTTNSINVEHGLMAMKAANLPNENVRVINIGSVIQKSWRIISRSTKSEVRSPGKADRKKHNAKIARINRLRLANISARVRMIMVYDQAKLHDALVVGTENRSEHLLGYFTRFGDEASDLEPIKHLFKTQVIELAKHLQIPKEIIEKPPTADLWQGQTDEKELGFSYFEADPILSLYEQGKSKEQMIKEGFGKDLVEKVLSQVEKMNFKQEVPYKLI
jgi:NAD+ synthase